MSSGDILPAAPAFCHERDPSRTAATDEFLWPDFPCVTPTHVRLAGGATETFPCEAATVVVTHCLACAVQKSHVSLVDQPNWATQSAGGS